MKALFAPVNTGSVGNLEASRSVAKVKVEQTVVGKPAVKRLRLQGGTPDQIRGRLINAAMSYLLTCWYYLGGKKWTDSIRKKHRKTGKANMKAKQKQEVLQEVLANFGLPQEFVSDYQKVAAVPSTAWVCIGCANNPKRAQFVLATPANNWNHVNGCAFSSLTKLKAELVEEEIVRGTSIAPLKLKLSTNSACKLLLLCFDGTPTAASGKVPVFNPLEPDWDSLKKLCLDDGQKPFLAADWNVLTSAHEVAVACYESVVDCKAFVTSVADSKNSKRRKTKAKVDPEDDDAEDAEEQGEEDL
jgi:hypothetical protein